MKVSVSRSLLVGYLASAQGYDDSRLRNELIAEINRDPEDSSRTDFEAMAAIVYPGALSAGRNKTFGTYVNCNLEKRWQGWKACDEFRAGIVPTRQRGKS